jgi:type II secretory pathway component PulJ
MRMMDFSSWQGILVSLVALALFALIGVGIRLVMMMTFQQRRERANRQINERLKTLMAAYKVLGGSFTGDLSVDPRHMRQLRRAGSGGVGMGMGAGIAGGEAGSER